MNKLVQYFVIIVCLILLAGCSFGPKKFEPESNMEDLNLKKQDSYSIDLSDINKPEKINPKYVNDDFEEVSPEEASYVLFSPSEYSKVGDLLTLSKKYKNIIIKQENLVNNKIENINKLKDLLEIERRRSKEYRRYWIEAENARRNAEYEKEVNETINDLKIYGLTLGTIAIFAFTL